MQSPIKNDILRNMLERFIQTLAELEEMSQVQRVTRQIDGWLTGLEGAALYHVAMYGPGEGAIVEIGSFKGRSTVWLARGSRKAGRELVYAIDTHQGSSEHQLGGEFSSHMPPEGTTEFVFRQNIKDADVEDYVIPLVMPSYTALRSWQNPIRFLFIDAEHTYEAVRSDFMGWHPHVVTGGLVAFHDVNRRDGSARVLDGPTKLVYVDVAQTGLYSDPIIVNHLALVSKVRAIPV